MDNIVHGMPFEQYKQVDALNMSTVVQYDESPLHFQYAGSDCREDTESMLWGRAVHCAAFEPSTFLDRYEQSKGRRTATMKEDADDRGVELMKPGNAQFCFNYAVRAAVQLSRCEQLQPFIASGQAEVSLFTEESGMPVKGRLDWVATEPCIVDLKTTRSMDEWSFSRSFYQLGYDHKLGMYQRWLSRLLDTQPEQIPVHILLMQNQPPFDCQMIPRSHGQVVPIPQAVLDRGVEIALRWFDEIAIRTKSGEWPGCASKHDWTLQTPASEMDDLEWGESS